MIAVFGCETARELLDEFIDGELPTSEQVAIHAHVRSCRTCAAYVDDMSLIGWSVRVPLPDAHVTTEDLKNLAVMQSGVLARVRAERDQSLRARLEVMFSDMRLLWPAVGATTAVILCLIGAANIWRLTTDMQPHSVAAMLAELQKRGEELERRGTDRHPLAVADTISAPRVLHDGLALDGLPESERDEDLLVVALVTQAGSIGQAEVLTLPGVGAASASAAGSSTGGMHVLNAMRRWRLEPAQERGGRPVAVLTLFLFAQTTAVFDDPIAVPPPAPSSFRETPRVKPAESTSTPAIIRSALGGFSPTV